MLTVTPDQRDALLSECDDDVACSETESYWAAVRRMPVVTALVDDLVLPSAEGRYEVSNVPRDAFISYLEHALMNALQAPAGTQGPFLRTWHACVTLLGELGHEIDGSIYKQITCHCAECEWNRERDERWDVRYAAAENDEERAAAMEDFRREGEIGPDGP